MTACGYCNAINGPADGYCRHCGATQATAPPLLATAVASGPENNIIPMERLLLLTFGSYGAYLFYRFYLTWRQYREHTGDAAYPVWQALTLSVPIYGWFRIYAHAADDSARIGNRKGPAAGRQPKGSQSAAATRVGRNIPKNRTQTKKPTKAVPENARTSSGHQPSPGSPASATRTTIRK